MSGNEVLNVYIDIAQLKEQKSNDYSLYLAKKVNGVFNVLWQSKGPISTANNPSYAYSNTFELAIPSFGLNYTNTSAFGVGDSVTSSGLPVDISLGNSVTLGQNSLFGTPTSGAPATPSDIVIENSLGANPNEMLLDHAGNLIFVNESGMDIGTAILTPIDTYQVWFGSYQRNATIIATNVSNPKVVELEGGQSATITYNAAGNWVDGKP